MLLIVGFDSFGQTILQAQVEALPDSLAAIRGDIPAVAVTSFNTRTGAIVPATNDYTWAQINKTTSSLADITTKSHTLLTDIGTNTHAQIDASLLAL